MPNHLLLESMLMTASLLLCIRYKKLSIAVHILLILQVKDVNGSIQLHIDFKLKWGRWTVVMCMGLITYLNLRVVCSYEV